MSARSARLALRGCALALALALGGCTFHSPGSASERIRFHALSTNRVPQWGWNLNERVRVKEVEATVVAHHFLWIPTRPQPPTLQEAIEDALAKGVGDVIVDAVVDHWSWHIPFFYGQEGWRVRGDVVTVTD